jgi:hypothetical protein
MSTSHHGAMHVNKEHHGHAGHEDVVEDKAGQSSESLPFDPPFDTTKYSGSLQHSYYDQAKKKTNAAVAYYGYDDTNIYVGLVANAGWVGFGMNKQSPAMREADIVVCQKYAVKGTEVVSGTDFHGIGNAAPELDAVQHWATLNGGSSDGITWCELSRSRTTCEKTHDEQVVNPKEWFYGLLAWGVDSDTLSYHGPKNKITQTFAFAGSAAGQKAQIESWAKVMTLEAPAGEVSSAEGSYFCSYHLMPINTKRKFNIVHFQVLRSESDAYKKGIIHHIDLEGCKHQLAGITSGTIVPCSQVMDQCGQKIANSPEMYSAEGDYLPDDVGIPIGKDGTMAMVISRHYYNPQKLSGVVDSGVKFKLTYSASMRPKQLRTISLGNSQFSVPPGEQRVVRSVCSSGCMKTIQGDALVMKVGTHCHGLCKATKVRLIRDGKELEPLSRSKVVMW